MNCGILAIIIIRVMNISIIAVTISVIIKSIFWQKSRKRETWSPSRRNIGFSGSFNNEFWVLFVEVVIMFEVELLLDELSSKYESERLIDFNMIDF